MFWLHFLFFLGLLNRYRHWLINMLTTSQCDNDLYFIHLRSRFSRKAQFMHSPRIGLCLGKEFPFFLYLHLIGKPCDGVLQVIYFLIKITLEPIYPFVQGAFHNINSLSQLHIYCLFLFHKITYHLAQIKIACSTGDEDGGGCGRDREPLCCRAPEVT